jgi:serine/threonine protein kinase
MATQLPPLDLVEVLSADQYDRWQQGERTSVTEYFHHYPSLGSDAEAACELVYCEYCLRADRGESPSLAEYQERFPQLAEALARKHAQGAWSGALPGLRATVHLSANTPLGHQPLERPPDVPDYELGRRIGVGGCGEVWMAKNRHDGGLCAVKIVPCRFTAELDGVRLYRKWASDHPALVSIKHVGEVTGFYYYVMPLADDVHGGSLTGLPTGQYVPLTLRHYLESRGRLPLEESVGIGCSMLTALAHLHAKGVSHCDVKPDNILCVRRSWQLGDIGLARPSAEVQATRGTLRYWPPEGPRDQTADLYALGLTLFELTSGAGLERFQEFVDGSLSLSKAAPRRAGRLRAVILRACHKDPKRRFASAPEMQRALTRVTARYAARIRNLVLIGLTVILAAGVLFLAGKMFQPAELRQDLPDTTATPANLSEASLKKAQELSNRSNGWLREGKFALVLKGEQETVEILKRELGPRHSDVALHESWVRTIHKLVSLPRSEQDEIAKSYRDDDRVHELVAQDKLKEAIELHRSILAIRQRHFPPDDIELARTKLYLGFLLLRDGQVNESLAQNQEAEAVLRSVFGDDNLEVLTVRHNVAMAYAKQKKYDSAKTVLEDVLRRRKAVLEPGHEIRILTQLGLAGILEKMGRAEEAAIYYREAKAEGRLPVPRDISDLFEGFAQTLTDRKREEDAQFFRARAEEIRRAYAPK